MQISHLKFFSLALVFCLLPNFGLRAQTTTDVSTAVTTAHTFAASGDILAITADGSIIVATGTAVTGHADGNNTITNAGEITSSNGIAIVLQSLNTIANTGTITGETTGIHLAGTALAATVAAQATRPAYDASDTDRDAYYFNNTVTNAGAAATITGKSTHHAIRIDGARAQILNTGGTITASGSGQGIVFHAGSGQSFVLNSGTITSASGNAIHAVATIDGIVIHNTGTLSSTSSHAIILRSLNLIVNSNAITGGSGTSSNGHGINLAGTALAATVEAQATRPAYDASQALRDAYYFNNKVINEVVGSNTGTITGNGSGSGINIGGARAQVLNTGGSIVASGAGHGIAFNTGSGQGFILNSGTITSASGNAIHAVSGIDEITIHNTGTLSSTSSTAIVLRSLNLIVNSKAITGGTSSHGILLAGTALAATVEAQATRPAYDASQTLRDAYYFNNKVINEVVGGNTGTITGRGTSHGINIQGARAQILNAGGSIGAEGAGHGIVFNTGSGQGFIQNTGSITSASGAAIWAVSGIDEIIIHSTGTMGSTSGAAIFLQSLNTIVNSGAITAGTNGHGINLAGTALAATVAAQATRPAYDSNQTLRDAYYFNNKVVNNTGGVITGKGTGNGILMAGARAQVLNTGGRIVASGAGHGIVFNANQNFLYNTGSIIATSGRAIHVGGSVNEIIIHNTGTIESTSDIGIILRSLNLVMNSGAITGGTEGIRLDGTPNADTITANPTAPAWDADEATRDAYYFNNIVTNEVGGTITGRGPDGHGIHVTKKRVQIFNHGDIVAEGTGHGIYFNAESGESIVVNSGTIRSVNRWGIYAHDNAAGSIVVINGGTIMGGAGAIRLSDANDTLVIRKGSKITGNVDFDHGTGDELIYAGAEASGRLADSVLLNLETTSESDSDSTLGIADSNASPQLGNFASLFALSDELILDLNAGIQDAIYEHKFSFNSEKSPRRNSSRRAPKKASEKPSWWTQAFGSFRAQDESDDNAKASHTLGGVLLGYDLNHEQVGNLGLPLGDLGFFLGVALGSLDTDDDAELTSQSLFGGANFKFTKDKFFYGVNFAIGFTSHKSERSVEESGETVNIKGDYTGFFLSPEFIIGMKTQVKATNKTPKTDELSFWERMKNQVNGMEIIPSLRIRYSLALLKGYDEDGDAESRISAEKRNTGTMESRAQVAFPWQPSNQAWRLEPRLGLTYRFDLNKSDFDVEDLETETAIDYDVEKESNLGFFGGLSVQYLRDNTAFKFNVDTIYSDESLILRGQAGFGFAF